MDAERAETATYRVALIFRQTPGSHHDVVAALAWSDDDWDVVAGDQAPEVERILREPFLKSPGLPVASIAERFVRAGWGRFESEQPVHIKATGPSEAARLALRARRLEPCR